MSKWLVHVCYDATTAWTSLLWTRRLQAASLLQVHAIFFQGEGVRVADPLQSAAMSAWQAYSMETRVPLVLCQTSASERLEPGICGAFTLFDEANPNTGSFELSSLAQFVTWTQRPSFRVLVL